MFYKHKMKERNIELLEQELFEKNKELQRLTEQNNSIRVANHKINHRLAVLEHNVVTLIERIQKYNYSVEINEQLAIALRDIKQLTYDYQSDTGQSLNGKPLPTTKIKAIDNLFEYFQKQFMDNKIDFNLKVSGSILYMTEHIIPQSKLETMIGDHLQDALIAIKASDNSFRSVLALLGLVGDCYEFTILDSGVPFEVAVLTHLGTKRITAHADTGGSGIGFMTTFETMRECGASLIINEKEPSKADYAKSVTIRFDGKNQYIIETYRPECFQRQSERYKLIEIQI